MSSSSRAAPERARLATLLLLFAVARPAFGDGAGGACDASPDARRAQYVVGYGSLMQDESRERTSPHAGAAHPVEIAGFKRGWFARGASVGFSTTFAPKEAASFSMASSMTL